MAIDPAAVVARTRQVWDDDIQPALTDYIRVPALSSAFDPEWAEHGHLDAVVDAAALWAAARQIAGLSVEVIRLRATRRWVIRHGKVIAETAPAQTTLLGEPVTFTP